MTPDPDPSAGEPPQAASPGRVMRTIASAKHRPSSGTSITKAPRASLSTGSRQNARPSRSVTHACTEVPAIATPASSTTRPARLDANVASQRLASELAPPVDVMEPVHPPASETRSTEPPTESTTSRTVIVDLRCALQQ
jgi:hypothetical protein